MTTSAMQTIARIRSLKKAKAKAKAEREAKRTRKRSKALCTRRLLHFIPRLTPRYRAPLHLLPFLDRLERLKGGGLRLAVSVPPRHGKSESILHWIVWQLLRDPSTRILYVAHTAAFARRQSRNARRMAKEAGVELAAGVQAANEWETTAGGGLVARGIDGDITGRGFDVVIVDDPIKGMKVAESAHQRETIWQTFTTDIFTRIEPDGGSVIVVHTRWHVDDLIGRAVKDLGFEHLNIPAIAEDDQDPVGRPIGAALWPERWGLGLLEERRKVLGEYSWAALFQGHPRPRGNKVFGEPHFYDEVPTSGYQIGYGVDLAYTAKTHADYSVLIRGIVVVTKGADQKPVRTLYILEVWRQQVEAPDFADFVKAKRAERPGPVLWYAAGTEKGSAQFFRRAGVPVAVRNAGTDKFQRAQPFAAAWNRGDVLVPSNAPDWLHAFLEELGDFTGVADKKDDQVDAGSALHDLLMVGGGGGGGAVANDTHDRIAA